MVGLTFLHVVCINHKLILKYKHCIFLKVNGIIYLKLIFFLISKVWRSSGRTSVPWTSSGSFIWLFCCSSRAGKLIKCCLFLGFIFFLGNNFHISFWKEECLILAVRKAVISSFLLKNKQEPEWFYLVYLLYEAV